MVDDVSEPDPGEAAQPPSDPTADPAFRRLVQHFLSTPPKPHEKLKIGKPRPSADEKPLPTEVENEDSRERLGDL